MSTLAEALAPKSDQLNADDLIPGPRTLKITAARISKEDRQTRIILNYEGDQGKPWKPCKTMGRAMVMVWSVTDESQLVGKSIRVYRDPEVRFGDQGQVGGIRISHMSHIDKVASVKLTVSQGKKSVFTFHPLVTDVPSGGITIDDAREMLRAATTLDELQTAWSRKIMAPFRDQLKEVLAGLKADLVADEQAGADQSQAGEAFTAEDLIGQIEKIPTLELLDTFETINRDTISSYSVEEQRQIRGYLSGKRLDLEEAQ